MEITIRQNGDEDRNELVAIEIRCEGIDQIFPLDVDFTQILDFSWNVHTEALDFLLICASIYAVDRVVKRENASDHWTRNLDVMIEVRDVERWQPVAKDLAAAVSFLTGDLWVLTFEAAQHSFSRKRKNRRKHALGFPKSPVVSLFSGGLDSYIAALNLLNEHRETKLLFVSHYDRHVSGPASEQEALRRFLSSKFLNRVSHLQVRTGVALNGYKYENSFRSRSLVFLGIAVYAAAKIGPGTPILIPENGPISVNMPLNPSRRGSCSTRTVHPLFIKSISDVLSNAGFKHGIWNPYQFKTKGEMVQECVYSELLKETYHLTNSCGKAGRKTHWANKSAHACGTCVPCLLRRAALHCKGWDTENYGNDAATRDPRDYPDFHALLGLIRERPSEYQIKRALMANGRIEFDILGDCAGVVERMIAEVTQWLSDKASDRACTLAGIIKKRK